jgi:hypothetical protein
VSNSYSEAAASRFVASPAIPKTCYPVRHEVVTAVNIKITLFKGVASSNFVETLKMETASSFEKLVVTAKYASSHP